MHQLVADWLARQEETKFADFSGAEVRLRLPVREGVANDLLARTVVAAQPNLQQLTLAIADANRVDVQVKTSAIPMAPLLTLQLVIERQLRFTPSPTIALTLKRHGLGAWLPMVLPFVQKRLPPEMTLTADGVTIDVGRILDDRGLGRLVPFIKSGEIESEPGILWIAVRLAVE